MDHGHSRRRSRSIEERLRELGFRHWAEAKPREPNRTQSGIAIRRTGEPPMPRAALTLTGFLILAPLPSIVLAQDAKPPVAATGQVSPQEVRSIAKEAYLYAYALMENYNTIYKQAVDPTAREYVGGFGRFRHYSEPST